MNEDIIIPAPVKFNAWKHHARFITNELKRIAVMNDPFRLLSAEMIIIGDSQTDMYTGDISVPEICAGIIDFLQKRNLMESNKYFNWLHEEKRDYKIIKIYDGSLWTCRPGDQLERFIHIHPGRNSVNVKRMSSVKLKTLLISALYFYQFNSLPEKETTDILRRDYLSLPPLGCRYNRLSFYEDLKLFLKRE